MENYLAFFSYKLDFRAGLEAKAISKGERNRDLSFAGNLHIAGNTANGITTQLPCPSRRRATKRSLPTVL